MGDERLGLPLMPLHHHRDVSLPHRRHLPFPAPPPRNQSRHEQDATKVVFLRLCKDAARASTSWDLRKSLPPTPRASERNEPTPARSRGAPPEEAAKTFRAREQVTASWRRKASTNLGAMDRRPSEIDASDSLLRVRAQVGSTIARSSPWGFSAEELLGTCAIATIVVLRRDGRLRMRPDLGTPPAGLLCGAGARTQRQRCRQAHEPCAHRFEISRHTGDPPWQEGWTRLLRKKLGIRLAEQARLRAERRCPLPHLHLRKTARAAALKPRAPWAIQLHRKAVSGRVPRGKSHGAEVAVAHDDVHCRAGCREAYSDYPRPAPCVQKAPCTDDPRLVGDLFHEQARPRVDVEGRK